MTLTREEAHNVVPLATDEVWEPKNALSHARLQHLAANGQLRESTLVAQVVSAEVIPHEVARNVDSRGTSLSQAIAQSRKQPIENLFPPRMQDMKVPPLRDALSMLWLFGQVISLDKRYAIEVAAEHASSEQSGHARSDHDCVALMCNAGKLRG